MKKILLIGGAGFIGHNTAIHLSKNKLEVKIFDSLSINNIGYLQTSNSSNKNLYLDFINERFNKLKDNKIELIKADARDRGDLRKKILEYSPDVIIHFAGVAHANRSNKDPYTTFDNSFLTLENTLDISKDLKCHLIYFSSSMVYGDFESEKVDEEHSLNPKGIYGALKLGGEKLVIAYNQVFELPYTIVRPSALYGERCVSGRVGQLFIENAINGKNLIINGDGEEKLDFTYVRDLAEGLRLIIENKNSLNQIFNLTYGSGRKINDLANIVKNYFPKVSIEYLERDKLIPYRGSLSIEKAKNKLGYNPEFPIEEGFKSYINWYKNRD